MRILICIFASLAFLPKLRAGPDGPDVLFNLSDFAGRPSLIRQFALYPVMIDATNGAGMILSVDRYATNTGTGAGFVISNITCGAYRSEMRGPGPQSYSSTNYFVFPCTNGLINAKDYVGVSTNAVVPSSQFAYTQAQSDGRYAQNGQFVHLSGDTMSGPLTNQQFQITGINNFSVLWPNLTTAFLLNANANNIALGGTDGNSGLSYSGISDQLFLSLASGFSFSATHAGTSLYDQSNHVGLSLTAQADGSTLVKLPSSSYEYQLGGKSNYFSGDIFSPHFWGDGSHLTGVSGSNPAAVLTNDSRDLLLTSPTNNLGTNVSAVTFWGSFNGNGAALTGIPESGVSSLPGDLSARVLTNDSRDLVFTSPTNNLGTNVSASFYWGDGSHLTGFTAGQIPNIAESQVTGLPADLSARVLTNDSRDLVFTSPTNNLGTNVSAVTFWGAFNGSGSALTGIPEAGVTGLPADLSARVLTNDSRDLVFTSPTNNLGTNVSASFFWGDGSHLFNLPSGSGLPGTNQIGIYGDSNRTNAIGQFGNTTVISNNLGQIQMSPGAAAGSIISLGNSSNALETISGGNDLTFEVGGTNIFSGTNAGNGLALHTYANFDVAAGSTISGNLAGGTNLPMVSSVEIPMGAWFTNNVGDGASLTAASSVSITNAGDGWAFASGSNTNCIRTRYSLPWDWDAGTVKIGIFLSCSGTNNITATNVVLNIRAAAIGKGDDQSNPTWGNVRITNNVNISAWKLGTEGVSATLTVGNSPSTAKGILWEIQRQAKDGGDTETNSNLMISQVRIYYNRNTRVDFPTSSP